MKTGETFAYQFSHDIRFLGLVALMIKVATYLQAWLHCGLSTPSEKTSTLNENNLLPFGANSFRNSRLRFQKEAGLQESKRKSKTLPTS